MSVIKYRPMKKNIDSGKRDSRSAEEVIVEVIDINSERPVRLTLNKNRVHYLFTREADVNFGFSPHYSRQLAKGNYFLLYDQNAELRVELTASKCSLLYVSVRTEFIHDILLDDNQHMVGLDFQGFGVKEYSEHPISPEADLILEELMNENTPTSLSRLYRRAKVMELMSYCYDVPEENRYENCPFLKDQENVERIKNARNILVENMTSPPSLSELSKMIGMNEYNLKVGFKNVYGLPAFKYLQQYRLNYSKQLLRNQQLQVSEIADEIGYSSASHFIDAFKKSFGLTPKKFQTGAD